MAKEQLFISSVQREFAAERRALAEYLRSDPLLGCFFEPFLFEEVAATTDAPGAVYLAEVKRSTIYIGLLGTEYGFEDIQGVSPTEREYDEAKRQGVQRWIYIKGDNRLKRHPKEETFWEKVGNDVSWKCVADWDALKQEVYRSCILYLKQTGRIESHDFDSSPCPDALLNDLDRVKLQEFVTIAREKRNFPLKPGSSVKKLLQHLRLLREGNLVNSALLAFGANPQRFFPTATIKCAHFHGLQVSKPIPDYKEFGGTVFDMAENAVDFVLAKISLSSGARSSANRVATEYEIPRAAIAEAIINAVAHRDYQSRGSVQVSVFEDRIEILNPGTLPPELELEDLNVPHGSYPHNPLLANCMFLTGDIERFGTGTLEIVTLTREKGLNVPTFSLVEGFKVTLWRPSATTIHETVHQTIHETVHQSSTFTDIHLLPHRLVAFLEGEHNRADLMVSMGLKNRAHFAQNYLEPALSQGLIQMTIPEHPRSRLQKYRLTPSGTMLKKKLLTERRHDQ